MHHDGEFHRSHSRSSSGAGDPQQPAHERSAFAVVEAVPGDDEDVHVTGRFQATAHRGAAQAGADGLRAEGTVDQPHDLGGIHQAGIREHVDRAHPDERARARIQVVEAEIVARAMAAATALAAELRLRVDDAVVIHNSNMLALHLSPCGVFARVALVGQEVAALEVELAGRLAATASPVAALEPRVEPRVYECDGFAVTLWTYYDVVTPDQDFPGAYADAPTPARRPAKRRDRDPALPRPGRRG